MSDIVYLSREAAYKFINSINPKQQTKQPDPISKLTKANDKVTNGPINMIANYGKILFKSDTVDVIFTNNNESNTVTFKRKKSWSNKKYIDQSFKLYGITPGWDFRYGWECTN